MAAVTFNPYSLKNATLSIAGDTYESGVSQVEFSPSVSASSFTAISGQVTRGQGAAEWDCTITALQDLTPGSLLRYLAAHDGETVTAIFTPVAGGTTITASVILTPGTVGGTAARDGSPAQMTVKLAVTGAPAFGDPVTTTTTTAG